MEATIEYTLAFWNAKDVGRELIHVLDEPGLALEFRFEIRCGQCTSKSRQRQYIMTRKKRRKS